VTLRRAALAAPAAGSVLALLLAAAATPGYDPRRETLSRLASAGQPFAWLVRVAIVVAGLVVVAAAGRAAASVTMGRFAMRVLVVLAGAAVAIAGLVPKDPPGVPPSTASAVHVGAAAAAAGCLVLAMAVGARWGRRPAVRRTSAVAAVVSTAAGAAFPFLWGTVVYGVLERVIVVAAGGWLLRSHR
jgi:hypothetical membrane protein